MGFQYSLYVGSHYWPFHWTFQSLPFKYLHHKFLYLGRDAFSFREGRALENLIPEMDEHAVDLLKVING